MIKSKEEIIEEVIPQHGKHPIVKSDVIAAMEAYHSQFPSQGLREEIERLKSLIERLRREIFNCGGAQIQ